MRCSWTFDPRRSAVSREKIPGSLVIERNVLEWRLDPSSDARLDEARGYDVRVIVFCSQGYTSSLAAASLQDLGLWRATDIEGGFLRWRAAGLPTARTTTPAGQYVAGSRREEL